MSETCLCQTEHQCPLHNLLDDDGNYFPGALEELDEDWDR